MNFSNSLDRMKKIRDRRMQMQVKKEKEHNHPYKLAFESMESSSFRSVQSSTSVSSPVGISPESSSFRSVQSSTSVSSPVGISPESSSFRSAQSSTSVYTPVDLSMKSSSNSRSAQSSTSVYSPVDLPLKSSSNSRSAQSSTSVYSPVDLPLKSSSNSRSAQSSTSVYTPVDLSMKSSSNSRSAQSSTSVSSPVDLPLKSSSNSRSAQSSTSVSSPAGILPESSDLRIDEAMKSSSNFRSAQSSTSVSSPVGISPESSDLRIDEAGNSCFIRTSTTNIFNVGAVYEKGEKTNKKGKKINKKGEKIFFAPCIKNSYRESFRGRFRESTRALRDIQLKFSDMHSIISTDKTLLNLLSEVMIAYKALIIRILSFFESGALSNISGSFIGSTKEYIVLFMCAEWIVPTFSGDHRTLSSDESEKRSEAHKIFHAIFTKEASKTLVSFCMMYFLYMSYIRNTTKSKDNLFSILYRLMTYNDTLVKSGFMLGGAINNICGYRVPGVSHDKIYSYTEFLGVITEAFSAICTLNVKPGQDNIEARWMNYFMSCCKTYPNNYLMEGGFETVPERVIRYINLNCLVFLDQRLYFFNHGGTDHRLSQALAVVENHFFRIKHLIKCCFHPIATHSLVAKQRLIELGFSADNFLFINQLIEDIIHYCDVIVSRIMICIGSIRMEKVLSDHVPSYFGEHVGCRYDWMKHRLCGMKNNLMIIQLIKLMKCFANLRNIMMPVKLLLNHYGNHQRGGNHQWVLKQLSLIETIPYFQENANGYYTPLVTETLQTLESRFSSSRGSYTTCDKRPSEAIFNILLKNFDKDIMFLCCLFQRRCSFILPHTEQKQGLDCACCAVDITFDGLQEKIERMDLDAIYFSNNLGKILEALNRWEVVDGVSCYHLYGIAKDLVCQRRNLMVSHHTLSTDPCHVIASCLQELPIPLNQDTECISNTHSIGMQSALDKLAEYNDEKVTAKKGAIRLRRSMAGKVSVGVGPSMAEKVSVADSGRSL